jgi:hypothetical protein
MRGCPKGSRAFVMETIKLDTNQGGDREKIQMRRD